MADDLAGRSGSGFRALTKFFLILSLVTLVYGAMNKSSHPDLLGRYSYSYAVLLIGIALVVSLLAGLLWRPPQTLVRWVGNIYAFIISAMLAILCVEVGLRLVNPWGIDFFHSMPYHMQGMVDHPQLGYAHPKSVSYTLGSNRIELNSHGLRDEEIPYSKTPAEKRILVLGDSVAFGWGVGQGETFSDYMEQMLREQTADIWQVINAGVNGYNTEQEATFLRIEGMRYGPNIVILVYVRNDSVDPVADPNETTWRRYPTWPSGLPQLLDRAKDLSYLFQLTRLLARMESEDNSDGEASDSNLVGRAASISLNEGWPASRAALMDIASQCRDANIPFLVAGLENDSLFYAELEAVGIEAVNLRPTWMEVPAGQRYVSRIDSHPSSEVHAKFAEYLVHALQDRDWLRQRK